MHIGAAWQSALNRVKNYLFPMTVHEADPQKRQLKIEIFLVYNRWKP